MTDTAINTKPKGRSAVHGEEPSTKEVITAKADAVREQASTAVDQAVTSAQAGAEELQRSLVKAGEKAREVTEQQPLVVAAGALALGVFIGLAINNRR